MIPPIPPVPESTGTAVDGPRTLTLRLDEHRRVLWSFRSGVSLERLDQVLDYVRREQARGDLTFDPKHVGWEWSS